MSSSSAGSSAGVADHPSVLRVRAALETAGARADRVVVLDEHARTAAAAAEQLGVTVAQIANSLVFAVPDDHAVAGRRPLLVLTSGAHRVDTGKVASLVGATGLERADPDFVRATTGFAIGGVAPVGHIAPIQTLVDLALAEHDQVWAAAGHARTVFPTTFEELVRITGGTVAEVA
jgi:prolyl-tRNA editing enzyme YbaK/EbsC (Cys-tRNA(Pro) deacylase)